MAQNMHQYFCVVNGSHCRALSCCEQPQASKGKITARFCFSFKALSSLNTFFTQKASVLSSLFHLSLHLCSCASVRGREKWKCLSPPFTDPASSVPGPFLVTCSFDLLLSYFPHFWMSWVGSLPFEYMCKHQWIGLTLCCETKVCWNLKALLMQFTLWFGNWHLFSVVLLAAHHPFVKSAVEGASFSIW